MSAAQIDLWKLLLASALFTVPQYEQLTAIYRRIHGTGDENERELAAWLVEVGAISPYQAKVLLAGRAGPFVYGDFKVYDRIESGRLAGTFKALHRSANRGVLLHFFSGSRVQDPGRWELACQQIERATALKHPHLCRAYKLVDQQAYKFLILENLLGQPALSIRRSDRSAAMACRIVLEAARGLAHIHAQSLVHADVRPENIWITADGKVKLLTYPLSKDALSNQPIDFTSSAGAERLNTIADYMAPELAMPGHGPSALSDIYALGCTLHEFVTGKPPFPGGTVATKIAKHATERITALESSGTSAELSKVVGYMMAKKAELRFQNAAAVIKALESHASSRLEAPVDEPQVSVYELAVRAGQDPVRAALDRAQQLLRLAAPVARIDSDPDPHGGDQLDPAIVSGSREDARPDVNGEFWRPTSRQQPAKKPAPVMIAAGCAALAIAVSTGAWLLMRPAAAPTSQEPEVAAANKTPTPPLTTEAAATPAVHEQKAEPSKRPERKHTTVNPTNLVVRETPDDNKTLWVSPTTGQPFDARYLPPGAQVVLCLRPADLMSDEEGKKVLNAMGPAADEAINTVGSATGLRFNEIETLSLGIYTNVESAASYAFVLHLAKTFSKEELLAKWGNPDEVTTIAGDGLRSRTDVKQQEESLTRSYYQSQNVPRAYFVPEQRQTRTVVIGSPQRIGELAAAQEPPSLRRDLESLRLTSDSTRQITLLVPRSFLMGEGKAFLDNINLKLAPAILDFLGDDVQAVALSAHFGETSFIELRALPTAESSAQKIFERLTDKIAALPQQVEDYLASVNLEPYGRAVLIRYPRMLAELAAYTRGAVEQRQAVWRSYLPAHAGHNLILGTELSLWQTPSNPAANQVAATPQASDPVKDAFSKTTSLSFPKDTLEHSLETLADDMGLTIQILGKDLQLDGITRNQSFALDEREKPVGEILRTILKKASPDGKLVYVVKPGSTGGKDAIFITTRAAAKKRGDKLPAELAQPPAGK